MVKYIILSEYKSETYHSIKRLGIFKHDSFIQEINFWYNDCHFTQYTMPMDKKELEIIAKAMNGGM